MPKNVPDLSLRNTKQEMLDAYSELLKKIEEQREKQLKPEEKIIEKKTAEVIKVADSVSADGVAKSINDLKIEIGKTLSQLSDNLEKEVSKYMSIQEAISVKEKELKEIYEIEKSASSLAALIEAQHLEKQQFEEEMNAKREKLLDEITAIKNEWEIEKKQYEEKIKERNTLDSKKSEREKEEYKYAFEREKQLAKDAFEYEKQQLEQEIKVLKEVKEKEFSEREKAIVEKEKEFNDLRAKVSSFPAELDAAVKKAVKEATDRIVTETKFKEDLLKKEFDGEKNVLNTRIASLDSLVKEQAEQISKLSKQLELSYQKIQDISVKAIEGASNFGSYTNLQQLLFEQSRKQTQEK